MTDRLRGKAPLHPAVSDEGAEYAEGADEDTVSALEEDVETDIAAEPLSPAAIDVRALWRTLMDVEQEQFTEVVADNDSFYSRDSRRHFVEFLGRKGTIDFTREDKVVVELAHKKKGWIRIGLLDLDLTTSEILAVDASSYRANDGSQLCSAGAELRFRSLMETDSRSRREAATSRLLLRQSIIADLIRYFDPVGSREPTTAGTPVKVDGIRERYGLNASQAEAFANLWSKRPLGLLQGPPGTGRRNSLVPSFTTHLAQVQCGTSCSRASHTRLLIMPPRAS